MKLLIERLEEAGMADNTVIAISPDHYPYGLTYEQISELLGHKVEENFELYQAPFILWEKGMEPIVVDKLCSSMDINPTISNLFGLEYDSRLMIGRDIFSDSDPLIIFGNHNWMTERGSYIASEGHFEGDSEISQDYIDYINSVVADKFAYSAQILEEDYYRLVVPLKNNLIQ